MAAALLLALLLPAAVELHARPAGFPDLPGWTCHPESTVYTPANLWDLIDGAADLFLEYRFEDLHLARYADPAGHEIRVEVYRHRTPEDAFGIYAAERSTDYAFVEIGTQGYRSEGIVNFLCGEYYVKLSTMDTARSVERALLDTGTRVAAHLGRSCVWPDELRRMPARGRIPQSETFVRRGFLGYTFLGNAFSAQYAGGVRCFLIRAGSAADADTMVARYRAVLGGGATLRSDGTLEARDPHHGHLLLRRRGGDLVGVYGGAEAADLPALLEQAIDAAAGR